MNLIIGSGDVADLLSGYKTKAFGDLLRKFVAEDKPYYNALASPIDALRTGAILEVNYLKTLSDDYFAQIKMQSSEMNIFKCSLDFAKIQGGQVVDFDELKSMWFTDFVDMIEPYRDSNKIEFIKKKFKRYYNQIQHQLYCSELESSNLVFIPVYSYVDEENFEREIKESEIVKFRIYRDEEVIAKLKQRGEMFQMIKNTINELN